MKAAEELKAYNVTVDWIVPGETHTADDFRRRHGSGHRPGI